MMEENLPEQPLEPSASDQWRGIDDGRVIPQEQQPQPTPQQPLPNPRLASVPPPSSNTIASFRPASASQHSCPTPFPTELQHLALPAESTLPDSAGEAGHVSHEINGSLSSNHQGSLASPAQQTSAHRVLEAEHSVDEPSFNCSSIHPGPNDTGDVVIRSIGERVEDPSTSTPQNTLDSVSWNEIRTPNMNTAVLPADAEESPSSSANTSVVAAAVAAVAEEEHAADVPEEDPVPGDETVEDVFERPLHIVIRYPGSFTLHTDRRGAVVLDQESGVEDQNDFDQLDDDVPSPENTEVDSYADNDLSPYPIPSLNALREYYVGPARPIRELITGEGRHSHSRTEITLEDMRTQGVDFQGIRWNTSAVSRDRYRQTRIRTYRNYDNLKEPHDEIKKEILPCVQSHEYFKFRHTRLAKCSIVHFQLRNLIWATGKNHVYYNSGGRIMQYNTLKKKAVPVVDCEARDGRRLGAGEAHRGVPVGWSNIKITTLAAKKGIVMVGGFYGEYIIKPLTLQTLQDLEEEEDYYDEGLPDSFSDGNARDTLSPNYLNRVHPDIPHPFLGGADEHLSHMPPPRRRRVRLAPLVVPSTRRRYRHTIPDKSPDEVLRQARDFQYLRHLKSLRKNERRCPDSETLTNPQAKSYHSPIRLKSAYQRSKYWEYSQMDPQYLDQHDQEYVRWLGQCYEHDYDRLRPKIIRSVTANSEDDKPQATCGWITTDQNGITNHIEISNLRSGVTVAVVSSNDDRARIMDLNTNEFVNTFRFGWPINCTELSPDKRILCVVGDAKEAMLIDSNEGKVLTKLQGHVDYSFACCWSPDGLTIATGNQDMTTRLYDVRNMSRAHTVLGAGLGAVRSLRYSPDGTFLAMAEPADFVHIFDVRSQYSRSQVVDFFGEIAGISFTPDDEGDAQGLFVGNGEESFRSLMEFQRVVDRHSVDMITL